jgi:KDO2-lipid IV(A) lauroyltransferase
LRRALILAAVSTILGLIRILPEQAAFGLARVLAVVAWWCQPKWRRMVDRNLQIFYRDEPLGQPKARRERARLGLKSAIHFGYHTFEFARMGFIPIEKALAMVVEIEGLEHMQAALAEGHGVIGLGLHYSNWELCGIYMAQRVAPVYGLGKLRDQLITRLLFARRERFGMRNIDAGVKMQGAILRALKEGSIFGILIDQSGGESGVYVPFAGTLANTGPGPAALALKTGAPILIVHTRRIRPGHVKLIIRPPLDMNGLPTEKHAAISEILTRINRAYEEVIREDPTQWLWGYKRWQDRPPGEPPLY